MEFIHPCNGTKIVQVEAEPNTSLELPPFIESFVEAEVTNDKNYETYFISLKK